jgi:hypothetical protein
MWGGEEISRSAAKPANNCKTKELSPAENGVNRLEDLGCLGYRDGGRN